MSWSALAWAVRQKLPSTQKLVLLMLAERHNGDSGQCNPSHDLLAEDCGLSRRSVVDQIGKLEEAGYLRVMHRVKGNAKLPNQYVLQLQFGVPERVKSIPDDPYLVVHDVHKGSEPRAQGVVQDVHKGSERAAHKPVNEPGIEPKIQKYSAGAHAVAKPDGVTDQTWNDWLQLRKSLKATVTQTAVDGIAREAEKAGYTLEAVLQLVCTNGWRGFRADWVQPKGPNAGGAAIGHTPRGPRPAPISFDQQKREVDMARWERQTGRVHPDRLQQQQPQHGGHVIDVTPRGGEPLFLGGHP